MPRIVVIGGGLSGAAFAVHLLRDHDPCVALTIVEPSGRLGTGLAYRTDDPAHRVNVAAGRMSLFPEVPEHFDAWARAQGVPGDDPEAAMPDGRLYPRRAVFGAYVGAVLRETVAGARARVRHLRGEAVSATPAGGGFRVVLGDGTRLQADVLVLAATHSRPDLPAFLDAVREADGVVADPWRPGALAAVGPADAAMVMGTGLTGCDVIASLHARGHRGRITAVSRRGLLPRPRTTKTVSAFGRFDDPPSRTALGLLRRVREAVREAGRADRPWEDVIDALRGQGRAVWGALPADERRRLLRHARPFWDSHRFQSAPQIDRVLERARAEGRLELLAATPVSATRSAGRLEVVLHPRGTEAGTRLVRAVDWIVNCTGPGHRSVVARHPVLRGLAALGALRADPCALGVDVDGRSRVLRSDGTAWDNLFVVGPLARGTHGELMGLPQVTMQPREVAGMVAALVGG